MMGRLLCLCSVVVIVASIACAPEPAATDPVARGRQLYRSLGCPSCHEGGVFNLFRPVGPPLGEIGLVGRKRIPGMSAEDYIRQSITDPGAYVVPGYPDSMPRGIARDLSPEDLAALVGYLASLR
ncbi:MAG TPA: c-type cytochrome [Candidatus Limnocylindria bacterium]|jgi:cytochrome c553|nr:c-type cytochrome [Candidatus Limnocylindria bacterium]